jgi:hypothetical protein
VFTVPARPNFFIVGAPKCGTTAMYEYLRQHPRIFMPAYKEPHYFATDLGSYPLIKTPDAYTALFAGCTAEHLRAGEASVYYLHSTSAISNIRDFEPAAKIIAMLRNPVDLVHALHSQLVYVGEETQEDFETAWRLQARRSEGQDVPRRCREGFLLQFLQLGRLGSQTERLLSLFPPRQVKLILFDDFASSPRQVYGEVIEFLEIPHDGRASFPRVNEGKRAHVGWLKSLLRKPPPALRKGGVGLKQLIGSERIGGWKAALVRANTRTTRRPHLTPAFRAELNEAFRDEVTLLGRLLGRDLSHWTAGPAASPVPVQA